MADDIDPEVPRWLGAYAEALGLAFDDQPAH